MKLQGPDVDIDEEHLIPNHLMDLQANEDEEV